MRACRIAPALGLVLCISTIAFGQTITEFPLPAGSGPGDITAGPDGSLWFTFYNGSGNRIGRITPVGVVTEFPLPNPTTVSSAIAAGPDGNLWFTVADFEEGAFAGIGRITPGGSVVQFSLANPGGGPYGIAAGPDGNLWFTEANTAGNKVGRITTTGAIQEFPLPGFGSGPAGIVAGSDGNLWFTENGNTNLAELGRIGRITTAGVISEFPIPTPQSQPIDIAAGPDGNTWFTEQNAHKIGRITTSGTITEFSIPTPNSGPSGITAGPDGNIWFTEQNAHKIGRITTSGTITEFSIPTPNSGPSGITAGPDGNIWFTESVANKIGRITLAGGPPPSIDTRILPVVGSTPGANGTFFRTALQLHNSSSSVISGRIVFHPSGATGSGSDPALPYSLLPEETQSIADLLPAMGRSGLGSADIDVTSGAVPTATVRVFNDAGAAGTTGFTEELMRAEDALLAGQSGVLLLPADLTNFRFNLGVRILEAGATVTLTLRDASGAVVATVARNFPATYHEQQSASAFLGAAALPAGGSISISVISGSAIFYGATVDNTTGDPSLQIARGPFDQ